MPIVYFNCEKISDGKIKYTVVSGGKRKLVKEVPLEEAVKIEKEYIKRKLVKEVPLEEAVKIEKEYIKKYIKQKNVAICYQVPRKILQNMLFLSEKKDSFLEIMAQTLQETELD